MRVLLVTHYYAHHGGGVEIVAGELATRLAARGLDVRWAASALPSEPVTVAGVRPVPMTAWNQVERTLGIPYPIWSPASLARLNQEVSRCDVVHLHDVLYAGNLAAAVLAIKRRRPLLVTQHIAPIPYRNRLLRWLMRRATATLTCRVLAACDQAVFISHNVMSFFAGVPYRRPPLFIPNGVDRARFYTVSDPERVAARRLLGLEPDRPTILFVGRFVETKGLAVVRALADRFPEYAWILAGRGPLDPTTWNLPQVRCLGLVPHEKMAPLYRAADLLVLPSFSEGFPLVVQEAMACGTPALITPEIARGMPGVESVTLLAEPNADDMARAVRGAFSSAGRLREIGSEAADFAAQQFDWGRCAEKYIELVQKLGRGKNGCAASAH